MTFDMLIKEIRVDLGLTQQQMAHELNVSFSTLNRWENGRGLPSRLALMQLIDFCREKGVSCEIVEQLEKQQEQ